jgi:hypothetical protein
MQKKKIYEEEQRIYLRFSGRITRRRVVIVYRRFGTMYRSQSSRVKSRALDP